MSLLDVETVGVLQEKAFAKFQEIRLILLAEKSFVEFTFSARLPLPVISSSFKYIQIWTQVSDSTP